MDKKLSAVIALGGKGTRLKSITGDIPKPLFPVSNISTLKRICIELKKYNINKIIFTLGYSYESFENEIKNISNNLNIEIITYIEEKPLGECGALWEIRNLLSDNILFLLGDIIFSVDFDRAFDFHKRMDSDFTLITHTSSHPEDSDLISAPNGCLIEDIFLKNNKNSESSKAYLGNSGICIFSKKLLEIIKKPKENQNPSIFNYLVFKAKQMSIKIYSYNTSEYIKDMGTEARYKKVQEDLSSGILELNCYKKNQKALFLDRDNTLIECNKGNYILDPEDIQFLDNNIKKIALKSKSFNLVCLVTNQPQISMGKLSIKMLEKINSKVIKHCISSGLKIDIVSFCPHHPDSGFDKEINSLKYDCFCRKPNPGMLFHQSFLRNINLQQSLLIGDSLNDELAAKNANCKFLNVSDL